MNMKYTSTVHIGGLLFGLALVGVVQAADTLETVEKEVASKFESVESVTADFTFLQKVKSAQFSAEARRSGSYAYKKGDGGLRKFRMEMKTKSTQKMSGNETTVESNTLIVDNGKLVLSMTTQANAQPSVTKTQSDPKAISGGGGAAIEQLKRSYEIKLLPEEKVEGLTCYTIEGKPKEPMPGLPVTNKSYFAKDSGILVKMEGFDQSGEVIQSMVYTNIKVNVPVSSDKFTLEIPENAQVIDMTQPSAPAQVTPQPASGGTSQTPTSEDKP